MSNRQLLSNSRRPRGRPSAASASSSRPQREGSVELPEYEPPSCPLDHEARRALADLSNNMDTRKYSDMLDQSLKRLTSSVSEINDRYQERKRTLEESKRGDKSGKSADGDMDDKNAVTGEQSHGTLKESVATLRDVVPELSSQIDLAVRDVIDWKGELQDTREALNTTKAKVDEESASAAPREQRRRRRAERGEDDEDDEEGGEDEDMDDGPVITGPLRILEAEKRRMAEEYAAKSLVQRYGLDNDYIAFKRLWHDSKYGATDKPLPNVSRWFNEGGDDDGADEDDDDLIIDQERIDFRCPLSMMTMTEPYTSSVCKHTYDKSSIYEFLNPHPNKAAKCPVPGCSKIVSKSNLFYDEIMLRRIKRQARENNADVDDDEEEEDLAVSQERHVKKERDRRRRAEQVEDEEDEDEEMEG